MHVILQNMRVFRGEYFVTHPQPFQRKALGFVSSNPTRPVTIEAILEHILDSTENTPFISVSMDSPIASRWAPPQQGAIYHLELSPEIQVIKPSAYIYEWMTANQVWKGESYLRAKEAIDMALHDRERLIVGSVPPEAILDIQLT